VRGVEAAAVSAGRSAGAGCVRVVAQVVEDEPVWHWSDECFVHDAVCFALSLCSPVAMGVDAAAVFPAAEHSAGDGCHEQQPDVFGLVGVASVPDRSHGSW